MARRAQLWQICVIGMVSPELNRVGVPGTHGAMVLRWAATALLATEKQFGRIVGHQELRALKPALNEPSAQGEVAVA